ncbi:hypothetical protein EGI26_14915 [Lacihabitans sp. CCS-44]|nr:hypothetical protein [Lacihabitans sp. CCS-44]
MSLKTNDKLGKVLNDTFGVLHEIYDEMLYFNELNIVKNSIEEDNSEIEICLKVFQKSLVTSIHSFFNSQDKKGIKKILNNFESGKYRDKSIFEEYSKKYQNFIEKYSNELNSIKLGRDKVFSHLDFGSFETDFTIESFEVFLKECICFLISFFQGIMEDSIGVTYSFKSLYFKEKGDFKILNTYLVAKQTKRVLT